MFSEFHRQWAAGQAGHPVHVTFWIFNWIWLGVDTSRAVR
jgi:hypothetical protein